MKKLPIKITLCYQYSSGYYDKSDLVNCVIQAVGIVNNEMENYEVRFDEIEQGESDNIIDNINSVIEQSDIVIFEISDLNSNVIYELGLSRGSNKKCIIFKEKSSSQKLPFDIAPLKFFSYSKRDFHILSNELATVIKKAIKNIPEEELLSKDSWKSLLEKFFVPVTSTVQMKLIIKEMTRKTNLNFYYIGMAGLLSLGEEWLDELLNKETRPAIYRIVFMKPLSEVFSIYKDEELLIDYCYWLIRYYQYVKNKQILLYSCPDVGWKAGMALFVADENDIMILTGTFDDFNAKGIWINDANAGTMFKEYAKILAIGSSVLIKPRDFGKYFSLSEPTREIPSSIVDAIGKNQEMENLRGVCEKYIDDELKKLG